MWSRQNFSNYFRSPSHHSVQIQRLKTLSLILLVRAFSSSSFFFFFVCVCVFPMIHGSLICGTTCPTCRFVIAKFHVLARRIVGITHGVPRFIVSFMLLAIYASPSQCLLPHPKKLLYKGKKSVSYMYVVMVLLFVFAF